MASLSEQKYTTLRKRLDQFGFKQPLAIESLPLVEKLFQAFIQTTEELKKAKENAPTHSQPSAAPLPSSQSSTTLSSAHPYKNDNARLVKENNDLHLELIKCREQLDHHVKDFKSQLRKLEHENADLRFLNTQYIHRLRSLEKESRQKDNKILELQEKNFQAVVQTPGGNKHTIPFRRQRLDIDEMLPESSSSTQRTSAQQLPYVNDPYIIDIVKVTEDRIAELELELQQQKQYVDEVETKMANLKYQVENRDREIERLHRVLDGGRSSDTLSLESRLRSNDKVIANQSAQIDFLHETNRALERRLQEVTELKRTLSDKQFEERLKASDLVRDLKDIDRLARKVQADKDFTVETADRELNEAKIEIQYNHREMQSLDTKVACLATEKKNLVEELEASRNQCGERENEIIRIQTLLERTQADKAKLSRQVSKLVLNEKDLLQELQKCRRTTKAPTPTVSGASATKKLSLPARLDIHLKNVEDERNMYKAENETLQKLLSERLRGASSSSPSASRLRGRSLSPTPGARTTGRRDIATSPVMQLGRRSGSNGSTSPTRCTVCGINRHRSSPTKDLTAFENQLRNVEEERDRFRRELNKHKRSSKILLNSMHRYIIRLHIIQATDDYSMRTGPLSTFIFDETVFIAVTAYQNDEIKNLKIDNNPFAKGFREPTHGKKNSSKSLKRLQSSLPLEKSTKYEEHHSRLCKSDSSLLSPDSISPPLHHTIPDSTTPTYINHHEQDLNFSPIYPHHQFPYNPYTNDSSTMMYNPYMNSTSRSTMNNFPAYGYYPTNNYNTPYF
ncbi:unnamed protein product [Adineta steineri]|uniref:T-box domain-containing protein n=2 Tax=Adineta steineri TaxID=433720 RepID=A0A814XJ76_9BILA|nr:unnamed protein product [Adineta steineri]